MRKGVIVFAVLLLALGIPALADTHSFTGRVTRVSDGDTLWVTDKLGVKYKIRMNRIDAPEHDQPYGTESQVPLNSLVFKKDVRVDWTERDKYGRYLGIVFLGEEDINLRMVKDGAAWHYEHFDNSPDYAQAENEAREKKLGLWADKNPTEPWNFRKTKKEKWRLKASRSPNRQAWLDDGSGP